MLGAVFTHGAEMVMNPRAPEGRSDMPVGLVLRLAGAQARRSHN
jgi:hypothetical protein